MPSRNIVKEYVENGVYHVYNRGINKQDIFVDDQDYRTFLYLLKVYLIDPESAEKKELTIKKSQEGETLLRKSFFGRVELFVYCLKPNHFHFMIKQKGEKDMSEFMRCVATNYAMYFNQKYDRVGTIFQGPFKAILVKTDSYLLHLSRYIHRNPDPDSRGSHPLDGYEWSSYAEYLGKRDTRWVKKDFILEVFESSASDNFIQSQNYRKFIEDTDYESEKILGELILE